LYHPGSSQGGTQGTSGGLLLLLLLGLAALHPRRRR
jgi:MYXO-CTERM domain-containing protein